MKAPIDKIGVHVRPDIEEILALAMLSIHGESSFPGVSKAAVKFVNPEDPDCDGKAAEEQGVLMVGVGHGRLDEHPKNGERGKEGECAATLVAKELGIFNLPEWKRLLAFVTANDLEGVGSAFDIGYIPKILYGRMPHKNVFLWAFKAVLAIHNEEKENIRLGVVYDAQKDAWLFDRIFAMWLKRKFGEKEISEKESLDFIFDDSDKTLGTALWISDKLGVARDPALEQLMEFAKDRSTASDMFNIRGVPAIIFRHCQARDYDGRADVMDWAFTALEAKYEEQIKFTTTTAEEFKLKSQINTFVYRGRKLKMAVLPDCDNPQIAKFARSKAGGYVAVIIQQNRSGNVQIFTNRRCGIDLGKLAQSLRFAEQEAAGSIEVTDSDRLQSEGMLARWYYHHTGQMLLNGSLKAKVPPTCLSLAKIGELALEALDD